MQTLEERVKKIISNMLNVPVTDITNDARLREDLHADSLDEVELVMELEHEFNVEISDTEADHLTTAGKIVAWLGAHSHVR